MQNFNVTVQFGRRVFTFVYAAKDVVAAIDYTAERYPEADVVQVDPL